MTLQTTPPEWDYTSLAASYEQRADYSVQAVDQILGHFTRTQFRRNVVDIGAGTGKLTRSLLSADWRVVAVEPNAAMRAAARDIAANMHADWICAQAEYLPLSASQFDLACFASSFNVVNAQASLAEVSRVLKNKGLMAILWNHRDLNDPLQTRIENAIRLEIPHFDYGSRRSDPTETVLASGCFTVVERFRCHFEHLTDHASFVSGWRSHATLARAAGDRFDRVIDRIAEVVPTEQFTVPFSTAVWLFQNNASGR